MGMRRQTLELLQQYFLRRTSMEGRSCQVRDFVFPSIAQAIHHLRKRFWIVKVHKDGGNDNEQAGDSSVANNHRGLRAANCISFSTTWLYFEVSIPNPLQLILLLSRQFQEQSTWD